MTQEDLKILLMVLIKDDLIAEVTERAGNIVLRFMEGNIYEISIRKINV